jgi:hypothetical protein
MSGSSLQRLLELLASCSGIPELLTPSTGLLELLTPCHGMPKLLAPYWERSTFWWSAYITGLLLLAFTSFSRRFLVGHISPTRTKALNSHHPLSPMLVEGIHTTGATQCPKGIICDTSPLSAIRPSARCLTPLLQWTRALFTVLGRYPPLQQGCLGLDF